jgi:hypothetical protein
MAALNTINKTITQLFSNKGVGGLKLTQTATLHLQTQGAYSPSTGGITGGNYYDPAAGTYTAGTAQGVAVIQRLDRNFQTIQGKDAALNLVIKPLSNVYPKDLIGVQITFQSRNFGISQVTPINLGESQIVWELVCQ